MSDQPHSSTGICILGLGLMGGSLARAARRDIPGVRLTGWNRSESARLDARQSGVFDLVADDPSEALDGADLVVLCVPVLTAVALMTKHLELIRGTGLVVMDIGSTKAEVCQALEPLLADAGCHFVGSHPICGGESSGFAASNEDLYRGAVVVVTPGRSATPEAAARVAGLWRQVGAKVLSLDAEDHDILLARTSHLPHVAAAALVHAVGRESTAELGLSGTGFVDTTRIAAGPEDVWHDILKSNAAAIVPEIRALAAELETAASKLERGSFEELRVWLAEARHLRDELLRARTELLADGGEGIE